MTKTMKMMMTWRTPLVLAGVGLLAAAGGGWGPNPSPEDADVRIRFNGVKARLVAPPPGGDDADPLAVITDKMSDVVGDLHELKTSRPVQGKQQEIVEDLDELIKQLQKQCNGSGGMTNNPKKPMTDSKIAKGPGGMGDLISPKGGSRNFGTLPPKLREQVLQSKTEGFPPGYESILQSYYSRLAQEKVGDEAAAPGGSGGGTVGPAKSPGLAIPANTVFPTPATKPAALP